MNYSNSYISKVQPTNAMFSRSIYFYKLLYMIQAVPPPIVMSTKLYIQRQVLSNQYCYLLLSWMRWNCVPSHPRQQQYVQFCAHDDGRRNRLKHVEQFTEINRSRKRYICCFYFRDILAVHGYMKVKLVILTFHNMQKKHHRLTN
jgi:hypothetical protein